MPRGRTGTTVHVSTMAQEGNSFNASWADGNDGNPTWVFPFGRKGFNASWADGNDLRHTGHQRRRDKFQCLVGGRERP